MSMGMLRQVVILVAASLLTSSCSRGAEAVSGMLYLQLLSKESTTNPVVHVITGDSSNLITIDKPFVFSSKEPALHSIQIQRGDQVEQLYFFASADSAGTVFLDGLSTEFVLEDSPSQEVYAEIQRHLGNGQFDAARIAFREWDVGTRREVFSRLIDMLAHDRQSVVSQYVAELALGQLSHTGLAAELYSEFCTLLVNDAAKLNLCSSVAIDERSRLSLGNYVPRTRLRNADSEEIQLLDSVESQYTLIEFWASWCASCLEVIPSFIDIHEGSEAGKLDLVFVSHDSDRRAWLRASDGLGLSPYKSLSNLTGSDYELANYYRIRSLPSNILVNRDREIVAVNVSPIVLKEQISR